MALPQDIRPVNSELVETLVRSTEMDWIETAPGKAYMKILWLSPETGRWSVLLRWLKGYRARPHKHLSGAHVYMLSGKLQVRDTILVPGDYYYEPNGMVHDSTVALEDTEYLFICDGATLYFDENGFTGYISWEQLQRLLDARMAKVAAE